MSPSQSNDEEVLPSAMLPVTEIGNTKKMAA